MRSSGKPFQSSRKRILQNSSSLFSPAISSSSYHRVQLNIARNRNTITSTNTCNPSCTYDRNYRRHSYCAKTSPIFCRDNDSLFQLPSPLLPASSNSLRNLSICSEIVLRKRATFLQEAAREFHEGRGKGSLNNDQTGPSTVSTLSSMLDEDCNHYYEGGSQDDNENDDDTMLVQLKSNARDDLQFLFRKKAEEKHHKRDDRCKKNNRRNKRNQEKNTMRKDQKYSKQQQKQNKTNYKPLFQQVDEIMSQKVNNPQNHYSQPLFLSHTTKTRNQTSNNLNKNNGTNFFNSLLLDRVNKENEKEKEKPKTSTTQNGNHQDNNYQKPKKSIFDAFPIKPKNKNPNAFEEHSYEQYSTMIQKIVNTDKFKRKHTKRPCAEEMVQPVIDWILKNEPLVDYNYPEFRKAVENGIATPNHEDVNDNDGNNKNNYDNIDNSSKSRKKNSIISP